MRDQTLSTADKLAAIDKFKSPADAAPNSTGTRNSYHINKNVSHLRR